MQEQQAHIKQEKEEMEVSPTQLGAEGPWLEGDFVVFKCSIIREILFGMIAPPMRKVMQRKPRPLPVHCSINLHKQLHLFLTMGQDEVQLQTQLAVAEFLGCLMKRTYKAGSYGIVEPPLSLHRQGDKTIITFNYSVWLEGGKTKLWPEMED